MTNRVLRKALIGEYSDIVINAKKAEIYGNSCRAAIELYVNNGDEHIADTAELMARWAAHMGLRHALLMKTQGTTDPLKYHIMQPTKTSCGPTCVAIFVERTVTDVIATLHLVSTKKRTADNHRTSVGEMARLVAAYGWRMEARKTLHLETCAPTMPMLLRVHRPRNEQNTRFAQGWHWVLFMRDFVFDPNRAMPMLAHEWFIRKAVEGCRVFAYKLTNTAS